MLRLPSIAALALVLLVPAPTAAQDPGDAALRMRVLDAATGLPLAGVLVGFPELELFGLTNPEGEAMLTAIPPGDHVLEVSLLGYGPASALLHLEPRALAIGDVELSVAPIEIEGITVDGRSRWSAQLERQGFYARSTMGFGHFFERLEIEQLNAWVASDLARGIPLSPSCARGFGLGASRGIGAGGGVGLRSQGWHTARLDAMKIFVDGVPWNWSVDDLPMSWVEGIEIYTRPTGAPAQYTGLGAGCGVILIWTG